MNGWFHFAPGGDGNNSNSSLATRLQNVLCHMYKLCRLQIDSFIGFSWSFSFHTGSNSSESEHRALQNTTTITCATTTHPTLYHPRSRTSTTTHNTSRIMVDTTPLVDSGKEEKIGHKYCGAALYNKWMVILGALWAVITLIKAFVKAARGGSFLTITDVNGEYYSYPIVDLLWAIIWQGLVLYADITFIVEVSKGIMSRKTYKKREEQSCCCV
eukprot:scaffold33744_cov171-Skeletonema_menzelii.AAC.2